MRLILITAAPYETVSGASFYHRRLLAAWNDMGGTSDVIAVDGPVAPDFAAKLDESAGVIVEGAAFEALEPLIPALQARGAAALIHHPSALEPGTPEPRRRHLKALESATLPGFGQVIAASQPIAQRLAAEFGVRQSCLHVLVPGTDHHPRRAIDHTAPFGSRCTILSLGTLTYRKGHDVLIEALATLTDLDWHLILAGEARDPSYAADLEALIARRNLTHRIERHGAVEGTELEALWARADLFALATRFEGFGMAIAEAMAHGLPVAITDGGAAASMVSLGTGVIAAVDDHVQLGKALRRLIFSPDLRAEMGRNAWTHARTLPQWPDQAAALKLILATPGRA